MSKYVIFSSEHTGPNNALFWRPDSAGYTTRLDDAGRYSKEDADKICSHGECVSIPEEIADQISFRVVDTGKMREWVRQVNATTTG